jgi:hypothetical protein
VIVYIYLEICPYLLEHETFSFGAEYLRRDFWYLMKTQNSTKGVDSSFATHVLEFLVYDVLKSLC